MITCAACRAIVNGKRQIFKVHRHPDFFLWMKQLGCNYDKSTVEQGFIDWDREARIESFVDRQLAYQIARESGQIISPVENGILYSEDLW